MTTSAVLITRLDSRTAESKSNGILNQEGDGLREILTRGMRCNSKFAAGTKVFSRPDVVPRNITRSLG